MMAATVGVVETPLDEKTRLSNKVRRMNVSRRALAGRSRSHCPVNAASDWLTD